MSLKPQLSITWKFIFCHYALVIFWISLYYCVTHTEVRRVSKTLPVDVMWWWRAAHSRDVSVFIYSDLHISTDLPVKCSSFYHCEWEETLKRTLYLRVSDVVTELFWFIPRETRTCESSYHNNNKWSFCLSERWIRITSGSPVSFVAILLTVIWWSLFVNILVTQHQEFKIRRQSWWSVEQRGFIFRRSRNLTNLTDRKRNKKTKHFFTCQLLRYNSYTESKPRELSSLSTLTIPAFPEFPVWDASLAQFCSVRRRRTFQGRSCRYFQLWRKVRGDKMRPGSVLLLKLSPSPQETQSGSVPTHMQWVKCKMLISSYLHCHRETTTMNPFPQCFICLWMCSCCFFC